MKINNTEFELVKLHCDKCKTDWIAIKRNNNEIILISECRCNYMTASSGRSKTLLGVID